MLKKAVYGIVVMGLVFSAQGASAENSWNDEKHGVTEAILELPSGAETLRYAAATKGRPMGQVQDRTQSSESPFPPIQEAE
ncbi:MAG: hypothetical protein HYY78_05650 [Betaproteobacteria bacterium]|nr:hypothetical protein [Betaproteobacteria bacterium]